LYIYGSESAHFYLNGKSVNKVYDMETLCLDGQWEEGGITLQAEWAELEYRAVRVKKLP